ncbi:hypothetical protein CXF85_20455 [Colwellia sp. 75C3]|uniref:GNAT family N-acetyltransferase n=1 Tax=Colwellia sp. 75C3 TaxID=888425 RepID=UPI000C34CD16|nr:GNAT family N-acetyltransferase [Colwellia sp. 75C3]PKG81128.1 hypothetical protein CXF85_20455 [Colwellia sp. 75C3]
MKTKLSIKLKKASIADCKTIFQWQSDPEIRKYSRNIEPVNWLEHVTWFTSTLSTNSTKHLYIIEQAKSTIGLLRFDQVNRSDYPSINIEKGLTHEKSRAISWEISIIIAPAHQGKSMACLALNHIPNHYKKHDIFAEVHQKNQASQKTFINAGFSRLSNTLFALKTTSLPLE